jgi:uncharacterized membrane protein SpoIIM required for sporulation
MQADQQEAYKRSMFRALVYKVGTVNMGICCKCCTRSFKKKGIPDAMTYTRKIYMASLGLMACQVLLCLVIAIIEGNFILGKDVITSAEILHELKVVEIPMAAAGAVISMGVIYCLIVNNRLMQSVSDK